MAGVNILPKIQKKNGYIVYFNNHSISLTIFTTVLVATQAHRLGQLLWAADDWRLGEYEVSPGDVLGGDQEPPHHGTPLYSVRKLFQVLAVVFMTRPVFLLTISVTVEHILTARTQHPGTNDR